MTQTVESQQTWTLRQKRIIFFSSFGHFHLSASQNPNHCPDRLDPSQTLGEPSHSCSREPEWMRKPCPLWLINHLSERQRWAIDLRKTNTPLRSLSSITCPFTGVRKTLLSLHQLHVHLRWMLIFSTFIQCFYSQRWSHSQHEHSG